MDEIDPGGVGVARRIDEMPDDTVLSKLVRPVDEVLPHQILREGEVPQDHVFDDLEAGRLLHRPADGAPDPADVDTALVPWQIFVEALDVDREILAEHLEQRGVETRLVVVCDHPDPATDGLPLEADGKQDQGRPEVTAVLLVPLPEEEAEREVERVGAAFLQGGPGSAVDVDGALVELLSREVDEHARGLGVERIPCVLLGNDLTGPLSVQLLVLGRREGVGNRQDPDPGAFGELVFEQTRIRADDRKAGFRRAVIEERIPDRKIEQLPLPALQTPLGCLRFLFLGVRGIEIGKRGRLLQCLFDDRDGGFPIRRGARRLRAERRDAVRSRLPDVDHGFEGVVVFEKNAVLGRLERRGKGRRRPLRDTGGLDQYQLVEGDALSQDFRLVGDDRGQPLRLEPDAGQGVPSRQGDDRIQPRLLEGGGKQHGRVEAGSYPAVEHLARQTDLLAVALEARGWKGVTQAEVADRRIDRGRDLPHPLTAAGLVPVNLVHLSGSAQDLARASEYPVDRRVVRCREGGKQLRHEARPAPFVVRQQLDRFRELRPGLSVPFEPKAHVASDGLGEAKQKSAVDFEVAISDRGQPPRLDPIHGPLLLPKERGAGVQRQHEIVDAFLCIEVLDPELAEHGKCALVRRKVQLRGDLAVDAAIRHDTAPVRRSERPFRPRCRRSRAGPSCLR